MLLWRLARDNSIGLFAKKPPGDGRPSASREDADGPRVVSVPGVASLERQILGASPVGVLSPRYGKQYGAGSGAEALPAAPAVHVDAAAYAALRAIDHGETGVFNIADPSDEVSTKRPSPNSAGARRLPDRDELSPGRASRRAAIAAKPGNHALLA